MASSGTQVSGSAPCLGMENYAGHGGGAEEYSMVGGRCEAGPATVRDTKEGVCSMGSPHCIPCPLAPPSVPVLLRDRQHWPQLSGGTLPVPRGLWCSVLGHPQRRGCLRDSGHW